MLEMRAGFGLPGTFRLLASARLPSNGSPGCGAQDSVVLGSCKNWPAPTELSGMDWDGFKLERLASELRDDLNGPEAERMIFAFEEVLRVARTAEELLPHLLAATTCLLAHVEGTTPRGVLETFFRRSVSDQVWRERYVPLFE
jgi:hypothetical protein